MKIVIGNYLDPEDNRNLILNDEVVFSNIGMPTKTMFAIVSNIKGIEAAPFRNGTGDWSGADGGYISSQLYSARSITISGTYIDRRAGCDFSNEATAQFDQIARLYIRSRLPIRKKQYIRIFMDSGMTFYTEGYCTDLQMDYDFIGHGDYQIEMYCPDPALYRGDADGTLGSEWNNATIRKENFTGYVSSGLDSLGDPYYTIWEHGDEENQGVLWKTGGRTNGIVYNGDMPYYPQFIIEPKAGTHVVNPKFTSLTDNKFFGLGYPDSSIAKFTVEAVDEDGGIVDLSIDGAGDYDSDYSGTYSMTNYSGSNAGYGASVEVTMTQDILTNMWHVTAAVNPDTESATGNTGWGEGYSVGDILTPSIPGVAAMVLSHGMSCVIDMAEHTALVNGNSVSYYITPGSEWFDLKALQTNNISFETALDDDDDSAIVKWRAGYAGI